MVGRAYWAVDLETLAQLGSLFGYLSVLVLALYINSDAAGTLYSRPPTLWIMCPMMLYWIGRLWLLTRRGQVHEYPVVFTIKDRWAYGRMIIALLALWMAW
jgi:hypothetical protein